MVSAPLATGPAAPIASEPSGTSLTRSVVLAGALAVGAAFSAQTSALPLRSDSGTRIGKYTDAAAIAKSTSLQRIELPGRFAPFVQPSTMEQIRTLAPLSLREWGRVFGVSHTAIGDWLRADPQDREDLRTTLAVLEDAARAKSNLGEWLVAPVPGLQVRPLDLLVDRRWRAFRGALAAETAPRPRLSPSDMAARRRAETSWAIADVDIERDEAE